MTATAKKKAKAAVAAEDVAALVPEPEPQVTKYAIDADGNYVGAFVGCEPPAKTIEVPFAPADARQKWLGSDWGPIPLDVPATISDRQFFQTLAEPPFEIITRDEALAAVKTGELPAAIAAIVAAMPAKGRFAAEMLLSGATTFNRDHALVEAFGAALEWTSEQIDEFWIEASSK